MSKYEAFLIHMEPKSLSMLSATIIGRLLDPVDDEVIYDELLNLANEIDARLQKIQFGIEKPPAPVEEDDWLNS